MRCTAARIIDYAVAVSCKNLAQHKDADGLPARHCQNDDMEDLEQET